MVFRIDVASPWRRLPIKQFKKYRYFHLAKWLEVPIIKEGLETERDYKCFCAEQWIDVRISIKDFDLRDKGHLMIRRTPKIENEPPERRRSIGSPINIPPEMTSDKVKRMLKRVLNFQRESFN